MYVVTLKKRFCNPFDNLPLYASSRKKDCEKYINNRVKEDCRKKHFIDEWFNGNWTKDEICESFLNDYVIWPVAGKSGK